MSYLLKSPKHYTIMLQDQVCIEYEEDDIWALPKLSVDYKPWNGNIFIFLYRSIYIRKKICRILNC